MVIRVSILLLVFDGSDIPYYIKVSDKHEMTNGYERISFQNKQTKTCI